MQNLNETSRSRIRLEVTFLYSSDLSDPCDSQTLPASPTYLTILP
jgi:hypothetical protein